MGSSSAPEVAARLVSPDRTAQLVAVAFSTSFVGPHTHDAVAWLQGRAETEVAPLPPGLEILWTGDAVLGRDYMGYVRTSLDRAALATVVLLLFVLLAVYRSLWLALVPLVTIGACVIIAAPDCSPGWFWPAGKSRRSSSSSSSPCSSVPEPTSACSFPGALPNSGIPTTPRRRCV